MLTLAAMLVVFVLVEKITLGREESLTASLYLSRKIWLRLIKCHSDVVFGKPKSGTLVNPTSEKPKYW